MESPPRRGSVRPKISVVRADYVPDGRHVRSGNRYHGTPGHGGCLREGNDLNQDSTISPATERQAENRARGIRDMSLAARLAILFALLSLVPLGVSGVLMYYRYFDARQQTEFRNLQTLATHKKAQFEHWIDKNVRVVREIANRPTVVGYVQSMIELRDAGFGHGYFEGLLRREHFDPVIDEDHDVRELFLLDAHSGRKLVSSDPARENRFHSGETYYLQGLHDTFVQAPHYPLSLDDASITVSTPIKLGSGRVLAVLGGHLDLAAITGIMQQGFAQQDTLDSYLVNRFNSFVTQPRFGDEINVRQRIQSAGVDRCLAGESGEAVYPDYRGVRVVGAFLWLPLWEQCLLVERDLSESMSGSRRFRDFVIILFMTVAAIVVALTWVVSRQVSRPISDVVEATENIGRGNLNIRLPRRSDGEMARLFDGVNRMAQNLGTVTASRDELDREVEGRLRVLESLQESKRRLNTLLSNLPGMAYRCDNSPDWTMRFVSEGCKELTGLDPADLVDDAVTTYADLVHPVDRPRVWARIQECSRDGRPFELEYRIRHSDGSWRWVWEKGRMVSGPEESPGILEGFIHDITERRRLARELQQAQKMEILGQVTGGVAHDFNNLLGVILGYTALARKHPADPEKTSRYLAHVSRAGERARDIVSQMLAFSRKETGTDEVIDIRERVAEEIDMLRSTMPATVDIELELHDNVPNVELQPGQLNQVLMNLTINARDAMNGQGTISICVSRREGFSGQCSVTHKAFEGDFVELEIADSGAGIDPERIDKIFDPFYTTKAAGKGSGLGLAVVEGIVRSHGGYIVVSNRPHGGAVFSVYFPVSTQRATSGLAADGDINPAAGAPDTAGKRVMIVDDEVVLAGFLAEFLQSYGYATTVFDGAAAALDAFRARPDSFDLVITDQTMPGMSGLELVDGLRTENPDLPIILCTGYSEYVNAESARERGIGFLPKPVDPERLLAMLAERLQSLAALIDLPGAGTTISAGEPPPAHT